MWSIFFFFLLFFHRLRFADVNDYQARVDCVRVEQYPWTAASQLNKRPQRPYMTFFFSLFSFSFLPFLLRLLFLSRSFIVFARLSVFPSFSFSPHVCATIKASTFRVTDAPIYSTVVYYLPWLVYFFLTDAKQSEVYLFFFLFISLLLYHTGKKNQCRTYSVYVDGCLRLKRNNRRKLTNYF